MRKAIAYSGGVDSTAVATALLRDHPEVEWTLVYVDQGQTSSAAQKAAMAELVRRFPAFQTYTITIDMGFNPTVVSCNGTVLQNAPVLPTMWAVVQSVANHLGADEVYTGYDRWTDAKQDAYEFLSQGIAADLPPLNMFGPTPRGIQGTLDECGLTWADVSFTVSCSGDPSDPLNPAKVPCGVCPKCIERKAFQ